MVIHYQRSAQVGEDEDVEAEEKLREEADEFDEEDDEAEVRGEGRVNALVQEQVVQNQHVKRHMKQGEQRHIQSVGLVIKVLVEIPLEQFLSQPEIFKLLHVGDP